jgi:RNA-splicing ligase RtcB
MHKQFKFSGLGKVWKDLAPGLDSIVEKNPKVMRKHSNDVNPLGTLGTGNHFIEVFLDERDQVWFMLHSGHGSPEGFGENRSHPAPDYLC